MKNLIFVVSVIALVFSCVEKAFMVAFGIGGMILVFLMSIIINLIIRKDNEH